MTNLEFFKAYSANELKATYDIIAALPADNLQYKASSRESNGL